MNKKDIIEFFDTCAPQWDADMIRNDAVINKILDLGGIKKDTLVLDIACGTGVLFDDYLRRGAYVTGVDISPQMVKIARDKFPHINIICADAETDLIPGKYDAVMIYNAFPHFPNPTALIENLKGNLKPGGRLTVAHGMSRAAIDAHHSGNASRVSAGLISEHELARLLSSHFDVDVKISDDEKYIVSGTLLT